MKLLAFIFGWWIYKPYSAFISAILRIKGIKVGRNLYIQGVPYLKIRGNPGNISFGENVSVYGDIDLRNRENGRIIVCDNVSIDTNVRFVAANNATLTINPGSRIGPYSIFNCGEDVSIGKDVLVAGFSYIQSSNHGIKKGTLIKEQAHTYGKISIGNDVWLGGHVSILAGVTLGNGAVIGAKSVVTKDISENAIAAGIPANIISFRKN